MNQDTLNMSTRKFLKKVGVTSQREIEEAIAKAIETGQLKGNETVAVSMTLEIKGLAEPHTIEGAIELE